MDRKESCKCDTKRLKRINVSCHKRTIISESDLVANEMQQNKQKGTFILEHVSEINGRHLQ